MTDSFTTKNMLLYNRNIDQCMVQSSPSTKIILSKGNLKTVSFGISIPMLGSATEKVPGISSILIDHLQRNTSKMNEDQFANYIDDHGISTFGSSGRTQMMLGLTCPPQHTSKALHLLQEMVFEPEFSLKSIQQIAQRKEGNIQQIKSNPEALLSNYTRWKSAFVDDKITNHPLGSPESIQEIEVEQLQHWHNEIIGYQTYFAAVGINISEKQLDEFGLEGFLDQFGTKHSTEEVISPSKSQGRVVEDKPQMDSSNAYIGINIRGLDPKMSKLEDDLYQSILSGGSSARLFDEIREKRNLSYAPRLMTSRFSRGSLITAMMDVRPDRASEAVSITLDTLHSTMTKPIEQEELNRSIKRALKVAVFVADSSSTYVSFILSRLATGREYDLKAIKEQITNTAHTNWQEKMHELWTREGLSFSVSGDAGDVNQTWVKKVEELM
jgi:zinc protease